MLKRDRTSDEKRFDAMLRSGLRLLGEYPSEVPPETVRRSEVTEPLKPPNRFPYYLAWDRWGRKGQKCRAIKPKQNASRVQIEFEDGFIATVSRFAIRRSD